MNSLSNFIEENDSFGSEKKFKINGREKFQTFLGGIFNFIILFIFLLKFFTSFLIYLKGEDPEITIAEDIDKNPITFKPGEEILKIIPSTNYFDKFNLSDYFYINAIEYNVSEPFNVYKYLEVNTEKNVTRISIPENKGNKGVILNGTFGEFSDSLNIIQIKFDFCKKIEGKYKCKDVNKFKKLLEKSPNNLFYLKYSKQIFNSRDYHTPLKEKKIREFSFNSMNIFKYTFMEIQNISVESEFLSMLGFSDTVKEKTFASISEKFIYSDLISPGEKGFKNTYFTIVLSKKSTSRKFFRKYPFIDELIGDAVVLTSWISIFIGFFYNFYNDQKYKTFLFNKLVNFNNRKISISPLELNLNEIKIDNKNDNDKDKDNENTNIANRLIEENKNFIEMSNIGNSSIRPIKNLENLNDHNLNLEKGNAGNIIKYKINENDAKLAFSIFDSEREKLKLNYYDYLLHSFKCRRNINFDKIENISNKLEAKLDILHYFINLKNLKLIENLILEKNQINILKIISKNIYSVSLSDKSEELEKKENKNVKDFNQFKNILENLDQSKDINIKILKEIFELKEK